MNRIIITNPEKFYEAGSADPSADLQRSIENIMMHGEETYDVEDPEETAHEYLYHAYQCGLLGKSYTEDDWEIEL